MGSLIQVRPGALSCMIVVIIFIDPNKDDVMRNTIPISHMVWPDSKTDRGG
jgi:hypothetical protein